MRNVCQLQVVVLLRQGLGGSLGHLLMVLLHQFVVDLDLWGSKGGGSNELEVGVTIKGCESINPYTYITALFN